MPELPEVETTVRGLRPVLDRQRIVAIETRRPDLRRPFPSALTDRLTGAVVTGIRRRAKYGLIDTDRGDTMIFHLGMSGRWRVDPDELTAHDHLVVDTAHHRLTLHDTRRFGSVDLVTSALLADWPAFAQLGPEPLGSDFTAAGLAQRLAGRTASIKAMLLDQRVVAGLGNIYVCEALHLAAIAPRIPAGTVSRRRLSRLVDAVRTTLTAAIAAGGSTMRDYARPDGELGYFSREWRVYGRTAQPCDCGGSVVRTVEQGRSTFWCRSCQR